MFANVLWDLRKPIVFKCYDQDVDREAFSQTVLEKTQIIADYLGDKTYLNNDKLCYLDFILLESLFHFDFITSG